MLNELSATAVTAEALRAVARSFLTAKRLTLVRKCIYTFVAGGFHRKKLCSRLSSSEVRFYRENGGFAFFEPLYGP